MARRRAGPLTVLAALLLLTSAAQTRLAQAPRVRSPLEQELLAFRAMGSVLYVAAHPDDENTQLITYLARGRGYRTAYLSLTRGDGGQNLLGPDFGAKLGVARTQELLAARRLDGGQQFFTRALDFGFSKDYRETLNVWDRQQVLSDVVRVIRTFQPDIIVTRFSPEPGGTHGHHTASAVLAVEAFTLAADPKAFPEQLRTLAPWRARRILQNTGASGGRSGGSNNNGLVRIDVSGTDSVLGESFAAIASRSRAMHITQGFGQSGNFAPADVARSESFLLLAGEPASHDIMDGVDLTWNRAPGGAVVGALTDSIIAQFRATDAAASVPALLRLRAALARVPNDALIADKKRQLDRILQSALGLEASTTLPSPEVVPGEKLTLRHTASVRSSVVPVRWRSVRYPTIGRELAVPVALQGNEPVGWESVQTLPPNTALSQPYWLREEGTRGMFRVDDAALIGRPEDPPAFAVEHVFAVGDQTLIVADQPTATAGQGSTRRSLLAVIAPVTLALPAAVRLFAPAAERPVQVNVRAMRPGVAGTVRLNAPAGWKVVPATQPFRLNAIGDSTLLSFTVTAPNQPATANIRVAATVNGVPYDNQREVIQYDHIPLQLLQPRARIAAVSFAVAIRGRQIGYLAGAGDDVPRSLEQLGYMVTLLNTADLTVAQLQRFDAVVLGIRAFNVRTDLAEVMPALFAYVEGGGNVIVQYNVANGLRTSAIAPYPLQISADRITDEHAAPTLLAPDHAALNTPNRITPADFEGWVQERGLYFPNQWDEHFTPIVSFSDPGERPVQGGLLVARHGRGYFVYTGLAFFRQLPAGVPGAYRLFANLLTLGK
jgi:LmbE family N-acetylglucosaminyl deacetylase